MINTGNLEIGTLLPDHDFFFPLNTHYLVITSNLITAIDVKKPIPTHILQTETHTYKLSFHLNALLLMYIRVVTKDMIHTAMI